MHHTGSMLHNVLQTAVSLRGQTWLGQTWLYLTRATNVPTVIGGIFRIFPNK